MSVLDIPFECYTTQWDQISSSGKKAIGTLQFVAEGRGYSSLSLLNDRNTRVDVFSLYNEAIEMESARLGFFESLS